ncbi:TIGR03936 family radical SAM-associated protein [Alkalithermobacter paradoxus]|uniref:DUF2344 domain-containing protein n=1 Tax=Alkalithermobacter paradoxus TaxID=29349 RepID=A0A1V4I6F3_9FIRM|nr:hypothetical protein CLOTH_13090 [[Clostridium] thermoalcaliphilum]
MPLIRCKFTKQNDIIYISHLDLLRLIDRTLRIAGIKVNFTQGFNPHPKIAFGQALSLGVSSLGEYVDIDINEEMSENEFIERINKVLPEGLKFIKAKYIDSTAPSLMGSITHGRYTIICNTDNEYSFDEVKNKINEFMNKEEIIDVRENKKGRLVDLNIRPMIRELNVISYEQNVLKLDTIISTGSSGNLKPNALIAKLNNIANLDIDVENLIIIRQDLYIENNGKLNTPI